MRQPLTNVNIMLLMTLDSIFFLFFHWFSFFFLLGSKMWQVLFYLSLPHALFLSSFFFIYLLLSIIRNILLIIIFKAFGLLSKTMGQVWFKEISMLARFIHFIYLITHASFQGELIFERLPNCSFKHLDWIEKINEEY